MKIIVFMLSYSLIFYYNLSYEMLELLQFSIKIIPEYFLQYVTFLCDKIKIFGMLAILERFFQIFHQFIGNENFINFVQEIFDF